MDAMRKQQWLEALRSGKYTQGEGTLCDYQANTYCCLGVLRAVVEPGVYYGNIDAPDYEDYLEKEQTSTLEEPHRCGLSTYEMSRLANMNDEGKSFLEIADYIEKNIPSE